MAKQGDYVRIHSVVLKAAERTAKLPEDTKACDLEQWTKGFLMEDGEIGQEVTVRTVVGRIEKGTLIETAPYYDHDYGHFVPELIQVDEMLRAEMAEIAANEAAAENTAGAAAREAGAAAQMGGNN